MRFHASASRHRLELGLMFSVGLLLSPLAQAQEPEIFGDEIEVRVINLEVRVSDGRGRHVASLRPGDFLLEVDGVPIAIEYFSEVRDRTAQPLAQQTTSTIETAATRDPAPSALKPGDRVSNSILVFIDNVFGLARDRRLVLETLADTVTRLEPGDRMLLVTYDGRRLAKIGEWESDADRLQANFQQAIDLPIGGLRQLGELNAFDRQGDQIPDDDDGFSRAGFIRQLSRKIERVLQAATSTLRGFADAPGRKVMLLAAGGWPRDPATAAVGFNPAMSRRTRHSFPDAAYDELVATANQLGYTLYPIDLPGKQVRVRGISAESRGAHIPSITNGAGSSGGGSAIAQQSLLSNDSADLFSGGFDFGLDTDREFENEVMLLDLARETGGRALINSQRQRALETMLTDTASYYGLGFTWTRGDDDRETQVRVKVPGTGLKVRSRRSFRQHSRQSEVTMQVESQLLFDTSADRGGLEVELGTPKLRRRVRQPAVLRFPLDSIVMVPTGGGFSAQLELRIEAIAEDGGRSDLPIIPVRLSGPTAPQPGQVAVVDVVFQLRNQRQKLILSLHDTAGGSISTKTLHFEPPE